MQTFPKYKKSDDKQIIVHIYILAGGLANLHPRLTVVRKVDAGEGSYPSVNTCEFLI